MATKKPIYIKILGTGIIERIQAVSYDIVGLPADTFHKMELLNGTVVYFNSFGVRSVTVANDPADLD